MDDRRGDSQERDELTHAIIGTFYSVYNALCHGSLESVYRNAMALALKQRGLQVQKEWPVPVYFRGQSMGEFSADLLVEEQVICELKTANMLEPIHEAQLLHYLCATRIEKGLLLNFGPEPNVVRRIYSNSRKKNLQSQMDNQAPR